uniref:Uncharacterized protein n=1 Tax=Palpitomonas bilix TaxID=652834 RepID=A0A7S3LU07_9EUKA|mmetsp:Transcript_46598/g.120224  ORF Transcript_46598/g.120224 Transcript_46598/m.120224 type:complete len:408 (+) Transcript_46598:56-1279(+)
MPRSKNASTRRRKRTDYPYYRDTPGTNDGLAKQRAESASAGDASALHAIFNFGNVGPIPMSPVLQPTFGPGPAQQLYGSAPGSLLVGGGGEMDQYPHLFHGAPKAGSMPFNFQTGLPPPSQPYSIGSGQVRPPAYVSTSSFLPPYSLHKGGGRGPQSSFSSEGLDSTGFARPDSRSNLTPFSHAHPLAGDGEGEELEDIDEDHSGHLENGPESDDIEHGEGEDEEGVLEDGRDHRDDHGELVGRHDVHDPLAVHDHGEDAMRGKGEDKKKPYFFQLRSVLQKDEELIKGVDSTRKEFATDESIRRFLCTPNIPKQEFKRRLAVITAFGLMQWKESVEDVGSFEFRSFQSFMMDVVSNVSHLHQESVRAIISNIAADGKYTSQGRGKHKKPKKDDEREHQDADGSPPR